MSESKPWIERVERVLARFDTVEAERRAVMDALSATRDPLRAQLFVEGRAPVDGGIIAPLDARLVRTSRGFELFMDGCEYAVAEYRVDPSTLLVEDGARVVAGQRLKHGDIFANTWIEVFGDDGRARVIEAACEQTGLSRSLALVLLRPMWGGVRLRVTGGLEDDVFPEGERLRRWADRTQMTEARFGVELVRALEFELARAGLSEDPRVIEWKRFPIEERARERWPSEWFADEAMLRLSAELPVGDRCLLDYRALARMDEEGLVLDHEPIDCGSFDITSGTISVSDVLHVERRPARGLDRSSQQSFGAMRGRWRVRVMQHHDGRVASVRLWREGARVWMRAAPSAFVECSGDELLVCDLSKPNVDRARASTFAQERIDRWANASNGPVALIDGLGVLVRAPPRKRTATLRLQRGFEDRVEAMELLF